MRKLFPALVCVFSPLMISAQSFSNSNLNSLVAAEFNFIGEAKHLGTKKAFYNSLSDSAITFGKTIRKGKKFFEGESDTTSWLNWRPVYTDIASSGDFGYNTGPWEFWATRKDDKPVAFGEFVTVWKKQSDGQWKALIDIGISHSFPMREEPVSTSANPLKKTKAKNNSLTEIENQFINHPDYKKFASKEIRIYRPDQLPTTAAEISKLIEQQSMLTYTIVGGNTSSSEDLGFVYGTVSPSPADKVSYYLRIWKKENGSWKIVLDLLTYQ